MAEYGLYVGDTTGSTPWNIWMSSASTSRSFGRQDPMVAFARRPHLALIRRHAVPRLGERDRFAPPLRVVVACVAAADLRGQVGRLSRGTCVCAA